MSSKTANENPVLMRIETTAGVRWYNLLENGGVKK